MAGSAADYRALTQVMNRLTQDFFKEMKRFQAINETIKTKDRQIMAAVHHGALSLQLGS